MTPERLLVKRQGDFHYPIVFQKEFQGLAGEVSGLKKNSSRICVVTDSHVAPLYLEEVLKELSKQGEKAFEIGYINAGGEGVCIK